MVSASRLRAPNFFILGAARCGTTSLWSYLRQHPDIFLPLVKEPMLFCASFQFTKNCAEYFTLFDDVTTERMVGEASHGYMSDPSAAPLLKLLFPSARFVVTLRHPADRAHSLYHLMRRLGFERHASFEEALRAEEDRFHSATFRRRCPHFPYNYFYFHSGLFGEQIERYFALFDPEQFHFITLDRLVSDPGLTLSGIYRFLGVSPEFLPDLRVFQRGNRTVRFPLIHWIWRTQITRACSLLGLQRLNLPMERVLLRLNTTSVSPMKPATRSQLVDRYGPDLLKLYQLTGVRLDEIAP
jgi:Sulfotransferase domain